MEITNQLVPSLTRQLDPVIHDIEVIAGGAPSHAHRAYRAVCRTLIRRQHDVLFRRQGREFWRKQGGRGCSSGLAGSDPSGDDGCTRQSGYCTIPLRENICAFFAFLCVIEGGHDGRWGF